MYEKGRKENEKQIWSCSAVGTNEQSEDIKFLLAE